MVRVGIAYLAVAWLLIQVADTVLPNFSAPVWVMQSLIFASAVGFPVALLLAWFYDLTPEGIKAASDSESTKAVKFKSRRIDYVIIGVLVLAVGFLLVRPPGAEALRVLPNSVAVLPLENLSRNPEDAFYADGIHQDIIFQLSKLQNLNVIVRDSVLPYASNRPPLRSISAALNARSLLTGSFQYANGQVRITLQLVDPATNLSLWNREYQEEFEDIFEVQADIATSVANALAVEFSLEEQQALERQPTVSAEAYALYLQARTRIGSGGGDDIIVDLLQAALAFDPDFSLAHYELARAYALAIINSNQSNAVAPDEIDERRRLARLHGERARELDPSFAWMTTGTTNLVTWRWSQMQEDLDGAPDPIGQQAIWMYSYIGQHDVAIRRARRQLELNPGTDTGSGDQHLIAGGSLSDEAYVGMQTAGAPSLDRSLTNGFRLAIIADEEALRAVSASVEALNFPPILEPREPISDEIRRSNRRENTSSQRAVISSRAIY